jgi:hypothetical protein
LADSGAEPELSSFQSFARMWRETLFADDLDVFRPISGHLVNREQVADSRGVKLPFQIAGRERGDLLRLDSGQTCHTKR